MEASNDITQLLLDWKNGQESALNRLISLVYKDLHRSARRFVNRERPGQTLQATALVHEAYVRLIDAQRVDWQNRSHFFAVAAKVMRQVLVDMARRRDQLKRGGEFQMVSLDEALGLFQTKEVDYLELDEALNRLAKLNPRQSQVVELRFFGGLSEEEIAAYLDVAPRTVRNDWSFAKVWLLKELTHQKHHDAGTT